MSLANSPDARTRPIPKGIVARALEGVRYAITGVAPDTWFGPLQPLAPMAPAEVAGRRFDYPTGYNLQYGPRAYEPVSFADLRTLADNCDILRLVIETRKDQIEAQDWDIRPLKQADGSRPRAAAFASDIAAAKAFFAAPDREHDFAQWTRQIAEEMFVTDATSLYKRRDRAGRICAFEIIDGTTIAPRIDAWGRTPAPPDVAYQQILHGIPAADYARAGLAAMTTDELVYYPRNKRPGRVYGQSPVEQIILTANIVTRRSLHQLAYYTDGNLTDAVFTAPSGWTAEQIKVWQTYWNALFAGNLRERRHGTWVPDGTKYVPLKDIVLKDAFDDYLARLVCFCFSISPQALVSQINRATAETAKEQATEEGLGPVLNWFKRLYDQLLQRHLGFADLEFVWIDDREMDPSAADAIDVADVKAGIRTINEVRMARGLDPLPGGDRLMVATGTGYVPVTQDGAATPQTAALRGRPQNAFGKFNPNHWPAGSSDDQGGRFAPKGEGGSGTASTLSANGIADAGNSYGGMQEGLLDSGVYRPQSAPVDPEAISDMSPVTRVGQGPLHAIAPPLHTYEMDADKRAQLLKNTVTTKPDVKFCENDNEVIALDEKNRPVTLVDETGAKIPGTVYLANDGTQNNRLIETVNAYAAGDGAGNGTAADMKYFSTRQALNDFLAVNPGWGEKYGNSDPHSDKTYIFAGAVNPGWEGADFTPAFTIDGQPRLVHLSAGQLADAVYWHEWSHLPPINNPGTEEGESKAWAYAFRRLGIKY